MYFASNVASFVCDDRVEEILWPGNIDEDELGGQSLNIIHVLQRKRKSSKKTEGRGSFE